MHDFAEEYVAELKARDERFDTRLGDDFYVSTFPNGVKTWIYLYEVNGYSRRQTLGVYPEMPLATALEALYAARRTRAVEKELMEQGLDGNSMVRHAEDSPINLTANAASRRRIRLPSPGKSFFVGAGTGASATALLAAAIFVFFVAPAPQVETAVASRAKSVPVVETEPAAVTAAPAQPEPPVIATTEAAGQLASVELAAIETAAVELAEPAPLAAASDSAADTDNEKPVLSASQREVIELQKDMTGTLAWSQLTSGIFGGEPVDNLGWIVKLQRPKRVFFFVRVRGMAGSSVRYRWLYQDALVKEDVVPVGEGWHSPAFSHVTLTPERAGTWRVEVLNGQGESLGFEQFETRVTQPVLSQR